MSSPGLQPAQALPGCSCSAGNLAGREALRADGWDIITLAEHYGVPPDEQVADVDWIEKAARQGWPLLMKNKRIRHRPAEIDADVAHKAAAS